MRSIRLLLTALLLTLPAACTSAGKPVDGSCQGNAAACHDLSATDKGGQGSGMGHGMGGGGMGM